MQTIKKNKINDKPVWKTSVAFSTAIIQGSPYSLATTEPCESKPPISVTNPRMIGKMGLQPISVYRVIRISPAWVLEASSRVLATLARPETIPSQTGVPKSSISDWRFLNLSGFWNKMSIHMKTQCHGFWGCSPEELESPQKSGNILVHIVFQIFFHVFEFGAESEMIKNFWFVKVQKLLPKSRIEWSEPRRGTPRFEVGHPDGGIGLATLQSHTQHPIWFVLAKIRLDTLHRWGIWRYC